MDRTGRRTPDAGLRIPDSGTVTVTESETETVTESETVTGFTWSRWSSRTPDPGPRPPDSGPRTGSDTDTVTVTDTDTGSMAPVTSEPTVSFSGDLRCRVQKPRFESRSFRSDARF